jgi:hypothetical protein
VLVESKLPLQLLPNAANTSVNEVAINLLFLTDVGPPRLLRFLYFLVVRFVCLKTLLIGKKGHRIFMPFPVGDFSAIQCSTNASAGAKRSGGHF